MDVKRQLTETESAYIWRLGQAKDNGILDLTWTEIANLINKEFREDISEYRSESAYRKKYAIAKEFAEGNVFKNSSSEADCLKAQKDEIYKEKRKLYDQRREYNKLLISEARAEHLNDELLAVAQKLNKELPLFHGQRYNVIPRDLDREGVLCLADIHYGMVTDNIWNKYNTEICKQRLKELVGKVAEYLQRNDISTLHIILLGDAAHGACHVTCRVKSEEDVCDQIMHVSELYAEVINELSKYVNKVIVYSCYGNHLRTVQNKQDSVDSDNIEKVIPWWLKQRLRDNNRVEIIESEYKEFTKLNVCGYNICCVHGNLDSFKNLGTTVNNIFTKRFGETIDYTISADKHHLEEFEQFGIESILVRCLCGTDDYANDHRLYSNAGQTFIVFNHEDGREATYNIVFK